MLSRLLAPSAESTGLPWTRPRANRLLLVPGPAYLPYHGMSMPRLMLTASIRINLPPVKLRPRNPAISDSTLDLIRVRRHARRCERSTRSRFLREVLRVCFGLWPRKDKQPSHPAPACGRLCRTWFRHILALNKVIAAALSKDKAMLFREMLQQSKHDGPSQFAHRIRAITRQGRKFRAPQSLPVLRLADGPVYGRERFQDVLGEHFASAERRNPLGLLSCCKILNGADVLTAR